MQLDRLESHRRPLRESELRSLRGKLGSLRRHARRASQASVWIGLGLFLALWVVTLLASDAPWWIVTAFWAVVGAAITLWVRRGMSREVGEVSAMTERLESAMRRNEAAVYDIRASAYVAFEEVEDEGACYAFDLGGGRVAFLSGQEFYPGANFPSLDFSLIYVLDEEEQAVDMLIEKRGAHVPPASTLPAPTKWELEIPESLSVFAGALDELEERLRPS